MSMDLFEAGTDPAAHAPLAERMRPREPAHFVGQEHLFADGRALRTIMDRGIRTSFVLWGPPGSGKTTIARMVASRAQAAFVELSAVSDGIPRIREVVKEAKDRLQLHQRRTVVFVDEIHRWNTTAQDAVLPHVENGLLTLIGATTENVSFELRPALLSRVRVYRLEALTAEHIQGVLERALEDPVRGLGGKGISAQPGALEILVRGGDGDVRKALGALELAAGMVGEGGSVTPEVAREATGLIVVRHDKGGDAHYQLSSALIKSIRGSDASAALYWLARLLAGGDVKMVIRRLLISASEDIGMADPQALVFVEAAGRAFDRVGQPEGDIILAQAVNYLATAPKSNRSYLSLHAARDAVALHPSAPVPVHLRNPVTRLDKEMGEGEGYAYPFDSPDHFSLQAYLPDPLTGSHFYEPSSFGFEKDVMKRMEWWRSKRES
jgi:putative ATPase